MICQPRVYFLVGGEKVSLYFTEGQNNPKLNHVQKKPI